MWLASNRTAGSSLQATSVHFDKVERRVGGWKGGGGWRWGWGSRHAVENQGGGLMCVSSENKGMGGAQVELEGERAATGLAYR